jgi:peroxiredoxin Q/BCP
MLPVNADAPAFQLSDQNGTTVSTSFEGKWTVLWWYPEANSGGCSMQAASIERSLDDLAGRGVTVLGASFNTTAENDDFACDKSLRLVLLSDADREVGAKYQVTRAPDEKFADKPRRTTYIIGPDARVAYAEDANEFPLGQYGAHLSEVLDGLIAARASA